jgi:hypothetical protein
MTNPAEYLKEQIAHCERLARTVVDELTSEWLLAIAAECRKELAALALQVA